MNNALHRLKLRDLAQLLVLLLLVGAGCSTKSKLHRYVTQGDKYFSAKQYNKAKIEYLNAFRLNQNNPHVLSRLGESFLHEGDAVAAAQLLARVCQLQPTNYTAAVTLGSIYFLAGELPKARDYAETALKTDPSNSDALILLANCASNTNEIASLQTRIRAQSSSTPTSAPLIFALGLLAQKSRDLTQAETLFQKAAALDSTQSKYQLALANVYWAQGKTNNAESSFQAAVQLAPGKSIESLRYADYLIKTRQAPAAKKFLNEAITAHPDFVPGLNMLSEVALLENDFETASSLNSKAIAQDPKNRDALLNRARIKIAKHESTSALTDMEQLAQQHTRDPGVQFHLAIAQLANNDSSKALLTLDKAISLSTNYVDAILLRSEIQISKADYSSAIPELNRLIRTTPEITRAYYLLATAYQLRGTPEDAINVYAAVSKLDPSDPQPAHLTAVIYRKQGKLPQAREAYQRALQINPDFLASIDALVELDLLEKKMDAAMARVQHYVDKYPDKPLPYLLRAKIFSNENKTDEAIASLEKAIQIDPEFYLGHRLLAQLYSTSGKRDQAVAKLQKLIAKDSKDVGALLQLALLLESNKDYLQARKIYESVLQINPNSIITLNNLAYLLSERLAQPEPALVYAQKARDLAPYDPFSADTFGWITLKKGDYSHALSVLQQAAEKLSDEPEVQFHLGMAYYMNADEAQARLNLENALQSKKEFSGREQASAALAILNTPVSAATPAAVQALQAAIARDANNLFAYIRLGQIYENRKDFRNAKASYETALKINRRSPSVLIRLAELSTFSLQDAQAGLAFAKEAWPLSQNGAAAAILGKIGYAAGDYTWSQALLLEARRAQADPAPTSYYLALSSHALAKLPEAKQFLEETIQTKGLSQPQLESAQAAAALISFQLDSRSTTQGIEAAVSGALQKNHDFPLALVVSGLLAERKNDFATAKLAYEDVLKRYPRHLEAQKRLALLLGEKLADDTKAEQMLKTLRMALPGDVEIAKAMGKLAYRQGDHKEAARLLKDASLAVPNDPEVLYYLGMAQYHLKDKQAKESLKRALALDSSARFSLEAKRVIAELN